MSQAGVALQHYQAGKVEVLLVTGKFRCPPLWDKDTNTVSGKAAGLPDSPWGVVEGFAVPKGVPQEHIDWLYKLFAAAAETEHHKQRETTVPGAKITLYTPAEANTLKMQVLEFTDPVVREMGLHIDQKVSMPFRPAARAAAGLLLQHFRRSSHGQRPVSDR